MRISVTLLDQYRYVMHGEFFTEEQEQRSLQELIDCINGKPFERTDDMRRGVAFHKIAEDPENFIRGDIYECDGWQFDTRTANEVLFDLPSDRISEVKMTLDVDGHTLVGIADYMSGLSAGDLKLTKKVTPDKYHDSLQWMAYLIMMQGCRFTYHVAQPRENRKTGVVTLADYKTFPFYRTKGTDERVLRAVSEFVDFAERVKE